MLVPSFLRLVALKANSFFSIQSTIQSPLFIALSSLSFATILIVKSSILVWAVLDGLIESGQFKTCAAVAGFTACNTDGMGMD